MPHLSSPTREAFARLIAEGWPPSLAAMAAGYPNARASRAAARLAEPAVRARVAELTAPPVAEAKAKSRARAADDDQDEDEEDGEAQELPPIMSEEEWMAEFAPHLLKKTGDAT